MISLTKMIKYRSKVCYCYDSAYGDILVCFLRRNNDCLRHFLMICITVNHVRMYTR